ncbi:MAG: xylulokinase [Anaerolineae bacterium]
MPYLVGIDIGTSSAKAVIVSPEGGIAGVAGEEHPIEQPQPGWAEQEADAWWRATIRATRVALSQAAVPPGSVAAIGLSGQMHGLVLLGTDRRPVRPAIIWADQRSAAEVERATATMGLPRLGRLTGNRLATGFAAASLLWLQTHEPDAVAAADCLLLPKDYVRLQLTGQVATDPSDASGTLLFNVAEGTWSPEVLHAWRLPHWLLPPLRGSSEIAGDLLPEAAEALGLPSGIPVVTGAADQAAQALGSGLIDPGTVSCTIGTGGQLLMPLLTPQHDPLLRLHTFCHALPGRWYAMGATLAAGLALRWFREKYAPQASFEELAAEAAAVPAGAEGLLFLPYLAGERTPHFDPAARGAFVGLTLRHGRGHAVRAIMEGVALALRDGLEVLRQLGPAPAQMVMAGGGGTTQPWQGIVAGVLGLPVTQASGSERTAVGAALLAGLGVKLYRDAADAKARAVRYGPLLEPQPDEVARYEELYRVYRELYPRLREGFVALGRA